MFMPILQENAPYYNEAGKSVTLADADENKGYAPEKYAALDMDSDGDEEWVVLDFGETAYLLLDREGERVYGYRLGLDSLAELKADGTFTQRDSVDHYVCSRITALKKGKMTMRNFVEYNAFRQEYTVNGDPVAAEVCVQHTQKTQVAKAACTWTVLPEDTETALTAAIRQAVEEEQIPGWLPIRLLYD